MGNKHVQLLIKAGNEKSIPEEGIISILSKKCGYSIDAINRELGKSSEVKKVEKSDIPKVEKKPIDDELHQTLVNSLDSVEDNISKSYSFVFELIKSRGTIAVKELGKIAKVKPEILYKWLDVYESKNMIEYEKGYKYVRYKGVKNGEETNQGTVQ